MKKKRRFCRMAALLLCAVLLCSAALPACGRTASGGEKTDPVREPECFVAGFASRTLEYEDPSSHTYYVAGYHNGLRATGVLDGQSIKALYLEAGGNAVLLIVVDCIGLASVHVDGITGRLPENLRGIAHVVSTHTHAGADTLGLWGPVEYGASGPVSIKDGKDSALMDQLIRKAAEAGAEAYGDRARGELYYSSTDEGIKSLQHDSRLPRCYDTMLHQLRFAREDGEPGIRVISYAAHAESLRDKNTKLSADYPGSLCDALTRETGDRAVYVPGAIGGLVMTKILRDENGDELPPEENVLATGELLAKAALSVRDERRLEPSLVCLTAQAEVPLDNRVFALLKENGILSHNMIPGPGPTGITVKTRVSLLSVEDLMIVCMPGELFPELAYGTGESTGVSATVKEIAGDDFMVIGLFDDEIGYIVSPGDFVLHSANPYFEQASAGHYEETNSLGPGTAGILLDALAGLVSRLRSSRD